MTPGEQQATARGSIELAGVTKRFGDTVAVKNIDLKIPAVRTAACSGRRAAARPPSCG